jgi:hypothetical protein
MEDKKLSIARVNSSAGADYITIELCNGDFTREVLIKLSLGDFAMALTGRSYVPCDVEKEKD